MPRLWWLLVWLAQAGSVHAQEPAQAITFHEARFNADGANAPQAVRLPDTWSLRRQPATALGHYRMQVHLPHAPVTLWALRADRLSTVHAVWINGKLVHGTLDDASALKRPVPTLITVPPGLLQAGNNELHIVVPHAPQAGLSTLSLGPEPALQPVHRQFLRWDVLLPQWLNLISAGIALFMLLLWGLRRQEAALGAFGALCLMVSLRNASYFVVGSPANPTVASLGFFLAQTATAVLMGVFAMAFSGTKPRAYRRVLKMIALLFPLLGLVAASLGELQLARAWLYPVLLFMLLPPVGLLMQVAYRRRSVTEVTLVSGLLVVACAGVHDYFHQQGHTSVMDNYWVPYAAPGVVMIFSTLLVKRLVRALSDVEGMNLALERRVAERTVELQAANAAKTRFLAAASHDLRQPMVSIGLLVGLLREQVGNGPLQRVVQRLQEAAGAMENLLTRLLDLSRLQAGTVRVQRKPLALQTLFEGVVATHAEQAQRKGLQLRVRATGAVVRSDPALLEQVLVNLIGNAVRYTNTGGVLLAARRSGPMHWQVAVWDTGPGIPAAQHQAIFGEFVRGEDLTDGASHPAGLGLGLAIVQRATELLDTRVELRSQPGRGSCFSLRLPAAPAAQPAPAPKTERMVLLPLAGLNVWLLEDNEAARASLQMLLQHWGATVHDFGSLADLAATAASTPVDTPGPDLLVTDHRLGDGQGTQALMRLRDLWPGTPALIVTGNTAPHELLALEGWREAGVPVLQKPFSASALLAALQQARGTARPLARHHLGQDSARESGGGGVSPT